MRTRLEGGTPPCACAARRKVLNENTAGKILDGEFTPDQVSGVVARAVPEYHVAAPVRDVPDGAEMWRIIPDGREVLVGVMRGKEWMRIVS